jgi:hypothetical protein
MPLIGLRARGANSCGQHAVDRATRASWFCDMVLRAVEIIARFTVRHCKRVRKPIFGRLRQPAAGGFESSARLAVSATFRSVPASSSTRSRSGPLVFARETAELPVTTVPSAQAGRLCGRDRGADGEMMPWYRKAFRLQNSVISSY